ncbi:hypothetical protein EC991_007346 [Linnemannia zychae]|nr:hypothetical protein EC991_007346 [Linnemannia zychae]
MVGRIVSFSLSPDGSQLATGHEFGIFLWWSRQAGTAKRISIELNSGTSQLAYSPCGRWIASVNWCEVQLWDLYINEHPSFTFQMKVTSRLCVAFTPTSQIILGATNGTLRLHDPHAQDPCTALKEISVGFKIWSLDCSPDGQELAIGAEDGIVYLWDFQSDKPGIELKGHDNLVISVAYSPCGKWILSGSYDKMVRVWRFSTGEIGSWSCATVVRGCSQRILSLAWNPAAVILEFVTGCEDGSVRVWRIVNHDDSDGGEVFAQMLWGNDIGLLCTTDLTFKGAIGLSPINQKLLVQRNAIDDSLVSERKGDGEEGLHAVEYATEKSFVPNSS